jgi:hypothetical protein
MWFEMLLDPLQKYVHFKKFKICPKQLVQNWWHNLGNVQASLDQFATSPIQKLNIFLMRH